MSARGLRRRARLGEGEGRDRAQVQERVSGERRRRDQRILLALRFEGRERRLLGRRSARRLRRAEGQRRSHERRRSHRLAQAILGLGHGLRQAKRRRPHRGRVSLDEGQRRAAVLIGDAGGRLAVAARELGGRGDLAAARPVDGPPRELEAREQAHLRQEPGELEREVATPHQRGGQLVGVDGERVEHELDGLPAARSPGGEQVIARSRPRRREARLHPGASGAEVVEDDPLVAAEERQLLIERRGAERAEIEAVGELEDPRVRLDPPERAGAQRPGPRDRAEARGPRGLARIDDVGPLARARRADADGVRVD